MIKIICDECREELMELGALLFSPPDKNGKVKKKHICVECYRKGFPSTEGCLSPEEAEKMKLYYKAKNLELEAMVREAKREYFNECAECKSQLYRDYKSSLGAELEQAKKQEKKKILEIGDELVKGFRVDAHIFWWELRERT